LEAVTECGLKFEVESAAWLESVDSPVVRTRLVFPELQAEVVKGDEVNLGIDIVSSELGATPMTVNLLLYRQVCKNGAIAVYEEKPYFYFDYSSAFIVDVKDLLTISGMRIQADRDYFFSRAIESSKTPITIEQGKALITEMVKANTINKGVAIRAINELDRTGASTAWEMVNALTAAARGFRDPLRLKYESSAGALLGLRFARNQGKDNDFATTAPDRALPPSLRLTA